MWLKDLPLPQWWGQFLCHSLNQLYKMKNLVYIGIVGVLSILAATAGAIAVKLYNAQKTEVLNTNDETPLVYDQGVIEASGYCKLKNQVIPIKSADVFLNEEFVQIVMQPEDQDMQPLMFTTKSSKWTDNIFRDSFTTVVVTDKTVVLKSELNSGTLISLKR